MIQKLLLLSLLCASICYSQDPLPSWNEGKAKAAILKFAEESVKKGGENYIEPSERIAVFDQDGTLWVEQPLYTQFFFAIERVKELAPLHPEWKDQEPFSSIIHKNAAELAKFSEQDIAKILAVTHAGMTVEQFHNYVQGWLQTALHPRYKKRFTDLVYQPMLEVIKLLKGRGFKTYIVSGGGQEFMRAYAEKVYDIPPENVIGTAGKVKYEVLRGGPVLMKVPEVLYIDDKTGKPEGINLIIGRRPYAAFGNSDGDQQMLEWTQAGPKLRLELLVHHDDAIREYAYDKDSKIGHFPETLMEEAEKRGWIVVSMKTDWKILFPWQKQSDKQE